VTRARSRLRWALFAACAALVLASMGWVSERMLAAERARCVAEADSGHQERVRLALWRMDTAMATLLAREGARPWIAGDQGVYGVDAAFDDERVRVRLLTFVGDVFNPLLTRTPRSPEDAAAAAALQSLGARAFAARVRREAPVIQLAIAAANEAGVAANGSGGANAGSGRGGGAWNGELRGDNFADRQQRLRNPGQTAYQAGANLAQQVEDTATPHDERAPGPFPGPLVPVWVPVGEGHLLAFGREVDALVCQGFALDWERVRLSLLAEVTDLVPDADLRPVEESRVATDETGLVLATAPAMLHAPAPPLDVGTALSPTGVGLAVAWSAVLASLAAAALLLRATVADADRRARFASSVTHELRTPLTTFRLYSEMLAAGMVGDEGTRQEYLQTLKAESARLAILVENVLAYARVEEGRGRPQRLRLGVGDLLERVLPPLRRRTDEAGMSLLVRGTPDALTAHVEVDADAIGQVLANVVDNACKYAGAATNRAVELSVERRGGDVRFCVRDHGAGLEPGNVAAAFTPFERGNRPPGDGVPGIGLGLALSRSLARDHGGDLVHESPADGPGAAFALTLPVR
jgi:signal transduction histidine kinase